jgi:hypothetical protein
VKHTTILLAQGSSIQETAVEGDGMEMDCRRQPGWTLNKRKEKIKTKKFRAMLQQLLLNA